MLDCCICSITSTGDDGFCCPACARAALYPLRIGHAKTLLAKEALRRQVDAVTARGVNYDERTMPPNSLTIQEGTKYFQHNQMLAETAESRERCDRIVQQSHALMEQIGVYKSVIAERKRASAGRRLDLASATAALVSGSPDAIAPIKKSVRKLNHRHGILYNNLMSARAYLCSEAATLMGLQRKRLPAEDGKIIEEYVLGGGRLMDLRDLNNYTNTEISAALDHIAHLLFLSCYYLGIRLPAELAIPGETHPSPTIYQPFSSYLFYNHKKGFSLPYNDIGLFGAQHVHQDHGENPRARPLAIDRKLVLLAREDPTQYSLCVEGMSLLAWDIAWLCRTQGINIADENWEDVCAIGRNLWLLLVSAPKILQTDQAIAPGTVPKGTRKAPSRLMTLTGDNRGVSGIGSGGFGSAHGTQQDSQITLGQLSHGTAYGFLGPSSGLSPVFPNNIANAWRFASPVRVIDKFKSLLLAEMSGLEWELLEEDEFGDPDMRVADTAPTLHAQREGNELPTLANKLTQGIGSDDSSPSGGEAKRGTSGWTKLKSRAKS